MDKIKVNNQIVAMRKLVKQAKIRVINKCTKEIKLLQNRKGNETQVLKCKRKAERLLLEVVILKKIKPDSVSKMALSKAKDWKAILARKNVSLEDRCFAMLANYKPVQMEVEKFHSANSYLITKIATLVEEWEEKAKLVSKGLLKNKKGFKKVSGANAEKIETSVNQSKAPKVEEKSEIKNSQQKNSRLLVRKSLEKEAELNVPDTNVSDSASEDAEEPMEESEMPPGNDHLSTAVSSKKLEVSKNRNKINESSNSFIANSDENASGNLSSFSNKDHLSDEDALSDEDSDQSSDEDVLSGEDSKEDQNADEDALSDEDSKDRNSDEDALSDVDSEEDQNSDVLSNESSSEIEATSSHPGEFESVQKAMTAQETKLKVMSTKKGPSISSAKPKINIKKLPTLQSKFSAEGNSTKAVALLNLNEMLDMDEIPIDNSKTSEETIQSGKRKRDTFFLNDNGEDFSGSDDNMESDDSEEKGGHLSSKKKQRKDFHKTDSRNDRFRNTRDNFKNDRNSFKNSRDSFKKDSNSFKNNRNSFKNDSNSFKNRQSFGSSQKFHSQESSFNKSNRDFHSKGNPNKFGKNQGKPENNFNKNRSNSFNRNEERQGNKFNRNMVNKNDRNEQKPSRNFQEKSFEKNRTFNKSTNDNYQRNKQESKAGKKEDLPLHPSWEAKRKMKVPVKAKFEGKRIVFND